MKIVEGRLYFIKIEPNNFVFARNLAGKKALNMKNI